MKNLIITRSRSLRDSVIMDRSAGFSDGLGYDIVFSDGYTSCDDDDIADVERIGDCVNRRFYLIRMVQVINNFFKSYFKIFHLIVLKLG